MNSKEIIAEVDELWVLLNQCRSVFPTLSKELIGHREFKTPSYYLAQGFEAHIQLHQPITEEFIEQNRRLGRWINENAIIRLSGIMQHHHIVDANTKIDRNLPGWEKVEFMRRMRNAFTKTPLSYRPNKLDNNKSDNVRLRDEVIEHFNTEPEAGEIPTSIDTVIEPIFKGCREYIAAKMCCA
jgi:hypothetical protein